MDRRARVARGLEEGELAAARALEPRLVVSRAVLDGEHLGAQRDRLARGQREAHVDGASDLEGGRAPPAEARAAIGAYVRARLNLPG